MHVFRGSYLSFATGVRARQSRLAVLGLLYLVWSAAPAMAQSAKTCTIEPHPTIRIGEENGQPVYLFQTIREARFLPNGRIAVIDAGTQSVREFSRRGRFLTQVGRRGHGPGEFESVGGLWLTRSGDIGVWDRAALRISTFDSADDLASTHRLVAGGAGGQLSNLEAYLGTLANGDIVLASIALGRRGSGRTAFERWTLARFGSDGRLRGNIATINGMLRTTSRFTPVPFSPVPYVATRGDSLFVASGFGSTVRVLDASGRTTRTITLPAEKVNSNRLWSDLEKALKSRGNQMFLNQLRKGQVPKSDRVPQVGGLLVDGHGNLWVKTYDPLFDSVWLKHGPTNRPGPGGEWRIVRPDGRVLAAARMPAGTIPLEIHGGQLLGILVDSLNVERIVVDRLGASCPGT